MAISQATAFIISHSISHIKQLPARERERERERGERERATVFSGGLQVACAGDRVLRRRFCFNLQKQKLLSRKSVSILKIIYLGLGERESCNLLYDIFYFSRRQYTLETHARSLQKWACTFPIFHVVVLIDSSN